MSDLPEPQPTPLSLEERQERTWNLICTFTYFVTFYACIHKLFIPLVLKFTSLSNSPYAEFQLSLILPLLLSFSIFRTRKESRWIAFLCGIAILFGVDEFYQVVMGRLVGWFAFSRLLSAIPLAIVSAFLLIQTGTKALYQAAWAGVFLLAVSIGVREYKLTPRSSHTETKENDLTQDASRTLPSHENISCGAQNVILTPSQPRLEADAIQILDCGLSPSILIVKNGGMKLKNTLKTSLNLHLLIYDGTKKKAGWNVLVPAEQEVESPKIKLSDNEVGLVYSDTLPSLGLSAIARASVKSKWTLSRKPLFAKEMQ